MAGQSFRRVCRRVRRIFRGRETAYLLCSGPSLNNVRLELFSGKPTVMLNACVLSAEKLPFVPTVFYLNDRTFLSNPGILEPVSRAIRLGSLVVATKNRVRLPIRRYRPILGELKHDACAAAISFLIDRGHREIVIFGLDWSYSISADGSTGNRTEGLTNEADQHFSVGGGSVYSGMSWKPPSLEQKYASMVAARELAAELGVSIVNATRGTRCDVFPIDGETYLSFYKP